MAITVQGFETTMAAFLATATALLLVLAIRRPGPRELSGLAVVALLAVLARPDLLPFAVCCLAGLGAWLARARDMAGLRRAALWTIAGFALPGVAWALWRWSYYGYALPNTAYVKHGHGLVDAGSLDLVRSFLTRVAGPFVLVVAVLLVLSRRRASGGRDGGVTWAVGSALVGVAAFLATGLQFDPIQGDLWRFQMPVLPVILLCLVLLASRDEAAAGLGVRGGVLARAAAWAGAAALAIALPLSTLGEVRTQVRARWTYDRKQAGLALAPFRARGLTMFVSESGALPWAAGWQASDLLGLNDHRIAIHGPSVAYVAGLRPALLQIVVSVDRGARFYVYHPFVDLLRTGRYDFATAILKTNRDLRLGVPAQAHFDFVRRDAPSAAAVLTALRALPRVRRAPPAVTADALRKFGYRAP
jgi:hypothetical protein